MAKHPSYGQAEGRLATLREWWAGLSTGYRLNVGLYALSLLFLGALMLEMTRGQLPREGVRCGRGRADNDDHAVGTRDDG